MELKILRSPEKVWKTILAETGLSIKNYDQGFLEAIASEIDPKDPPNLLNYKSEFKRRNISTEKLIGAFFSASKPLTLMMRDVCIFFARHGIKGTNNSIRMKFDFGADLPELEFDLENFKEIIRKSVMVIQQVEARVWDTDLLWQLLSLLRKAAARRNNLWTQNQDFQKWVSFYDNGYIVQPEISKPSTPEPFGSLWDELFDIWRMVVGKCNEFEPNRENFWQKAHSRESKEGRDRGEEILVGLEIPTFAKEDMRGLAALVSDHWLKDFGENLFALAEKLNIPFLANDGEFLISLEEIQTFLSRQPIQRMSAKTLQEQLEKLLRLPIWKRRHELYSAWVLCKIDQALDDYSREVYARNGELLLKFSGTHIWTAKSQEGDLFFWSELRTPLTRPIGKGRKRNIQPDFRINLKSLTDPYATKLVVEAKQYLHGKLANFRNAILDYARGCPNAGVILVNYGSIPEGLKNIIPMELSDKIYWLDHMQPEHSEQLSKFKDRVRNTMPQPSNYIFAEGLHSIDSIFVDVSRSMDSTLSFPRFEQDLLTVIELVGAKKLMAVDSSIRGEWTANQKGIREILNLPRGSSTNLDCLGGSEYGKRLVITDEEGRKTISDKPDLILIINYIDNEIKLNIITCS